MCPHINSINRGIPVNLMQLLSMYWHWNFDVQLPEIISKYLEFHNRNGIKKCTICPPQNFEATYGSGWDDETALHKFMEDIMSTADDMEAVKSKLSLMETSKIL